MNVTNFTHGDLDGAACSIILRKAIGGSKISFKECSYTDDEISIDKRLDTYLHHVEMFPFLDDGLVITDISPSEEICDRIEAVKNKFKFLVLLDHHETVTWLDKYDWAYKSEGNKQSAALTTLNWCVSNARAVTYDKSLVKLARAADAYDRWDFSDRDLRHYGENLNMLYRLLGFKQFIEEVGSCDDIEKSWMSSTMFYLRQNHNKEVVEIANKVKESDIKIDKDGNKYMPVIVPQYLHTNDVAHMILDNISEDKLDYVAALSVNTGSVSLRSRQGGCHVGNIAKAKGGGGHQPAAGYRTDLNREVLEKI